ncbi:MAG: glycoside hydrolase family 5 protein [Kiritimatiellae bacterium]|jgi:endoglucanase|nr:glycoside hydrolase family 5 protein [Kiritimatiellia bacterium]
MMTDLRKQIQCLLLAIIPMVLTAQQTPMMGVNLAGAEFGGNGTTYGQDYIYPGESQLNYFHSKGLKLIRLPFKWHRIQPDLYGNLSSAELGRIDTFLDQAEARGMQVILDLHNYAGRTVPGFDSDPTTPGIQGYKIGDTELPVSAYKDVWKKMAAHFKNRSNIWAYGLMNEPSGISTTDWLTAVQAAVDGVREEDMNNYVLLPGTYWSNAHQWPTHGEYLLNVVDSADKRIFEAHSYWDGDHNGDYSQSYAASGVTPSYGVDDLEDFVDWCNANDVQGFVGEFGIDWRDPDWAPVLENALAYMEANGISATYWAGGPWWTSNYPLDLEVDPRTNEPRYPLDILAEYGDGTSQPYAPNFRLYWEGITSGLLYSYPYSYGGAGASVTVDPESTDQAKSGSRSFKVTYTLPSGSYANCGMHIENGVYLTDNINIDGHVLVLYVRGDTGANFNLRLKDVTGASGPQVTLTDFGPVIGNSWQRYEIPLTDLVNTSMDGSEFIERVRLDLLNKDNTTRTFYIDNMEVVGPEYVPVVPEPPSSGTLLSETFDDDNADGWVTNGGNWVVEFGEIVSNNAGHNIAWWDAPAALNWSNYTLSADVASTDNDGIGLAFYVQDEDNYYYVSMSKQDTKTRLYKMVNGSATLLATNHSTGYTTGQTYALEVTIDNGAITVRRDGQTILTKTDTTFTQGSVGLSSTWNANAYHDNVQVSALP